MAKRRSNKNKGIHKKDVTTSKVPISKNINSDAIAAALSSINQPVFLKVCRLCETKDGPFLNIFDSDRIISKKVEEVMPFVITENDDLPHKICFRCSAKVEELYEFVQKCVKTQINLRTAIGKKGPPPNKVKTRTLWEEKLNQSNISNDDICDALIKKAMESIKDMPLKPLPIEEETVASKTDKKEAEKVASKVEETNKNDYVPKQEAKVKDVKNEEPLTEKVDILLKSKSQLTTRSKSIKEEQPKETQKNKPHTEETSKSDKKENKNVETKPIKTNTFSLDNSVETVKEDPKPFNIMDYVSMIKVNGVGVLFQCKLCNRNFLKKEVVLSHGCSKNGGAKKIETVKDPPHPPEPPKMPSVKYINTKIDSEPKKPITFSDTITLDDDDDEDEDDKPLKSKSNKPKVGPASKVKKANTQPAPQVIEDHRAQSQSAPNTGTAAPTIQFPALPSLNSRYKLVPGPNNTFTLVEEGSENSTNTVQKSVNPPPEVITNEVVAETKSKNKVKASKRVAEPVVENTPKAPADKPYPVGLFQTLPHNSNDLPSTQPPFTTPAMKKQSYTIVQTGNPSKLLISTKPQAPLPPPEVPKKKKKLKHESKIDNKSSEPFSVTLEDAAPPRDPGFFTFINVDPLLQPSYVLPTASIIQESQISTSTSVSKTEEKNTKDLKYTCNMCDEKFSREKKLLSHIQSHYNKMDEEDQVRVNGGGGGSVKRRGRPATKK